MKTQHFFIVLAALTVLFAACKKDNNSPQVKKEVFSGYAQKGPFVNGSSVAIIELDENLDQTGKTYFTTIMDNFGSFEQKNIELISNYVELKADGYFFEEIGGSTSIAPITLYALVNIADVTSANLNVLTHLEKPRVEYLVKQGNSFSAAKQQALREILAIFGFSPSQTLSERLNLTDDAILIAISCILQGNSGVVGALVEFMVSISADIKEDGKLDNMALGAKLMHNAIFLTTIDVNDNRSWLPRIRENMEKKYPNVTIPDFESYVQAFANSNLYP